MFSVHQLKQYAYLMRLHKPIGILLLLWPTCWALWLAAGGVPPLPILFIFVLGVILMRSAGCVVNDIFDRNFDRHVARTRNRPLATGAVSVKQALMLTALLALAAFILVLFCNTLTIMLAIPGALFAVTYPLLKRITHLPQLGLGVAFSWGVPMAFAAVTGHVPASAWLVFVTALLWPVIYDTMYAMADRDDDVKIGVKSTAILFGRHDVFVISILMLIFMALLIMVGITFNLSSRYYLALVIVAGLFVSQLWLIRQRNPEHCLKAFLQNNAVGLVIFLGI
jgi:4-hydroxybenzoate polyprenyltransferase